MKLELKNTNTGAYEDLTSLISHGGVKYASSPFTASKSVTTMSGKTYRGLISEKDELSVSFISLNDTQAKHVSNLIAPEYFMARYYSPREGHKVEKEVYVENKSMSFTAHEKAALDGSSYRPVTSGEGYSSGNGRYSSGGSLQSNTSDYSNSAIRVSCGFTVHLSTDTTSTPYSFTSNGNIGLKGAIETNANSKVSGFIYCTKGTDIRVTNATARTDNYVLAVYSSQNTSSFIEGMRGQGIAQSDKMTFVYRAVRDCYIRVACRTTTSSTATITRDTYSISSKPLVINFLNENKVFISNCLNSSINADYTVDETRIPVGTEYISISFRNTDASKIVVVPETVYWSKLSITLKER